MQKHQMQQHRCGAAIVLLSVSHYGQKTSFYLLARELFIFHFNFSCSKRQKMLNRQKAVEIGRRSNAASLSLFFTLL